MWTSGPFIHKWRSSHVQNDYCDSQMSTSIVWIKIVEIELLNGTKNFVHLVMDCGAATTTRTLEKLHFLTSGICLALMAVTSRYCQPPDDKETTFYH